MGYIEGVDRAQQVLFPEVLDDYVRAEHPVRFIDAFVTSLDLTTLGFERATPAETGRPAYDPGGLLRLYIYGYLYRLRSSRKLEQETHRNVELMWLLCKLTPDFKTIADFRRDNTLALTAVCREFTLLCKRLDLFAGELGAIDGSKFRAVNSKSRNFTPAGLDRLQRGIETRIAEYLGRLDRQDQAEGGTPPPSAAELQQKIDGLRARQEGYAALLAQLAASGETQISLTDPESRSMKVRGGVEVCYNVQTAVDDKHTLIVAQDVTNAATDRDLLSPLAKTANEVLGAADLQVIADQGYDNGPEIAACLDAGITPTVPSAPHVGQCETRPLHEGRLHLRGAVGSVPMPSGGDPHVSLLDRRAGARHALLQHVGLPGMHVEGAVYAQQGIAPHHALGTGRPPRCDGATPPRSP